MAVRFLRIKNWNELYENNETRKLKNLHWVRVPNGMESISFRELISHRNGLAHFGVWILLLELASKQPAPRDGTISRSGGRLSHDPESIAKAVGAVHTWDDSGVMEMVVSRARFDLVKETVSEALDRLVQLNWVEVVEIEATSANPMQVVEKVAKSGESPDVPANFPAKQNRTEQNKYCCPTDVGQNGSNHTKRNSLRKATDPMDARRRIHRIF